MTKTNPLLKTCQICGLKKPLTAFLQLSAKHGTVYGSTCSACRKTKEETESTEETTSSQSDYRIGHKEKLVHDIDRLERYKQKEEDYHKERDEAEEEQLYHLDKTEIHQKKEKEHRSKLESENKKPIKPIGTERSFFGGVEQTAREARIDLSVPVIDTAIPKIKHQSVIFKQFTAWLGPNAPIVSAAQKLFHKNEKKPPASSKEFIKDNWIPPKKGPKG
jgi:hypothetical protein